MPRLRNRQRSIPNGLTFIQPQTNWQPRKGSSFQGIVESLIAHRRANPRFNLSTDPAAVADEVDAFNAAICERMGWNDYIISGADGGQPAAVPFPDPKGKSLLNQVGNVVAGSETIVDWIKSGAEAVPEPKSTARAKICVTCPKNTTEGGLLRWFTKPAAAAIKAAVASRKGFNLSTPVDDKLGVCSACSCELHLKVHLPLERIKPHMDIAVLEALDERCWILLDDK